MLWRTTACHAEDRIPANQLVFKQIFASRIGDPRSYHLLGGGWVFGIQAGSPTAFITAWNSEHPAAVVKPISRMFTTNTYSKRTTELVYIWIEDGAASLNVDMIRAGLFPGAVMVDMVDREKALNEQLSMDPRLAETKAAIDKERAKAPQDRSERLVPDDEYRLLLHRIEVAEAQARHEKLGIWADSRKADRESVGLE